MKKISIVVITAFLLILTILAGTEFYNRYSKEAGEKRHEKETTKTIQQAEKLVGELRAAVSDANETALKNKALELVQFSNGNPYHIENDKRVSVSFEQEPKLAMALIEAEATDWADSLKKDTAQITDEFQAIPLIKHAYQWIYLSGQPFEHYGFNQEELETRYTDLSKKWNEKQKEEKANGSIAFPPTVWFSPVYQIKVGGKPLAMHSNLDDLIRLIRVAVESKPKHK